MRLNVSEVRCAWCKKRLRPKVYFSKNKQQKQISHGICKKCAKNLEASM